MHIKYPHSQAPATLGLQKCCPMLPHSGKTQSCQLKAESRSVCTLVFSHSPKTSMWCKLGTLNWLKVWARVFVCLSISRHDPEHRRTTYTKWISLLSLFTVFSFFSSADLKSLVGFVITILCWAPFIISAQPSPAVIRYHKIQIPPSLTSL